MTGAELLDVAEVERLRLRPDDAIVIKTPYRFSDAELTYVHETMAEAFPGTKILVLECGMDIAVVRAEEATAP